MKNTETRESLSQDVNNLQQSLTHDITILQQDVSINTDKQNKLTRNMNCVHQSVVTNTNNQQLLTQNMHDLQHSVSNNTHNQSVLINDINNLQQSVSINTNTQQTLTRDITNITQSVTDIKNTLQSLLSKLTHTETGEFDCAGAHLHNGGISDRYVDMSHTFNKAYAKPPTFHYSVYHIRGRHTDPTTWYRVSAQSVTCTGFTVRCTAFANYQIYTLRVRWIAVASFEEI